MRTVDIIVMGKTGAGKSTLINAVLEEELAPTGIGQAVTTENQLYSKKMMIPTGESIDDSYGLMPCQLSMYDTVGLEIDHTITEKTLAEIKQHMQRARESLDSNDISLVWFCINELSKRLEPFEVDLIKKLSLDYEIPFVIVLTQSISKKKGDLEKQILDALPDVPIAKVLAKEYPIDDDVSLPQRGIKELLQSSVDDYQGRKIKLLEQKINLLDERRKQRIEEIKRRGKGCIEKHSSAAVKVGIVPLRCIPIVHGICIKMLMELNDIAGIKGGKGMATDLFVGAVVGVVAVPLMAVPLLSVATTGVYVQTVGEKYFKALLEVLDCSTDSELNDNALMKKRIKENIRDLKNSGGVYYAGHER